MAITIIRAIVLLCAASLVACTSLRQVDEPRSGQAGSQRPLGELLAPGERVFITTKDGDHIALRVTAASEEFIDGTVGPSDPPLRVPLSEVDRIERREFSAVKTGVLIFAILGAAYVQYLYGVAKATSALLATG